MASRKINTVESIWESLPELEHVSRESLDVSLKLGKNWFRVALKQEHLLQWSRQPRAVTSG